MIETLFNIFHIVVIIVGSVVIANKTADMATIMKERVKAHFFGKGEDQ